jgi:hypothetical protein
MPFVPPSFAPSTGNCNIAAALWMNGKLFISPTPSALCRRISIPGNSQRWPGCEELLGTLDALEEQHLHISPHQKEFAADREPSMADA